MGTFRFRDGAPDPATVRLAYDQIDFSRGIEAFVRGMAATSVYALCRGLEQAGVKTNGGIGITEQLMDARSLFLTPNTTTVYVMQCLNLNDGPMVVRVPPRALGPVDDADFRWVTDVGVTGPDKGAGGDYLFVPPGYTGAVPQQGFHIARPRTNRLVVFLPGVRGAGRSGRRHGEREGEGGRVPAGAGGQSAGHAVREPLGRAVQHDQRQRLQLLRGAQCRGAERAANWVDPDPVGLYAAIGIRKDSRSRRTRA